MNRLQRTIAILSTLAVVLWCAYAKIHEERIKPTFIQQEIFKK